MTKPFDTLLVANRGEIACRILKSAKSLGFKTVAVFSEADRHSCHVKLADSAVCIGPAAASESYLRIDKIIDAAKRTQAGAIHPGYGFLSENTEFVQACDDASIVFVGPPVNAMQAMGKKREAKEIMREAGVPVVPGTEGAVKDEEALVKAAQSIGVPIMVKASAGGGGRGMRLVNDIEDVRQSIRLAKAEAENAFGDGEIILERAVLNARHVEIQVFADQHGNCIHLGERDCSVQRRHQKIIEEAPSPAVTKEIREKMGAAAVQAAKAIGYVGAGTVEFLLEESGDFYFMEMNTRLQVEHPVTEFVTGLDLVQMQLDVALGQKLPLEQKDVTMTGHAIEVRLYAEDSWAGFLPQTGRAHLHTTELEGVRIDHGLDEGQEVTPHYDAMVAKIIVHGRNRQEALRKMRRALARYALHGVTHNQAFLDFVLTQDTFILGKADTKFVERELENAMKERPALSDEMRILAAATMARTKDVNNASWASKGPSIVPLAFMERGERQRAQVAFKSGDAEVKIGKSTATLNAIQYDKGHVTYCYNNVQKRALVSQAGKDLYVQIGAQVERFERAPLSDKEGAGVASGDAVLAPMAGLIVDVRVKSGDLVEKDQVVAVLEAMKMQLELKAPREGEVDVVEAKVGIQLNARDPIATLVRKET